MLSKLKMKIAFIYLMLYTFATLPAYSNSIQINNFKYTDFIPFFIFNLASSKIDERLSAKDISILQRYLAELGYYKGVISSKLDPSTSRAIGKYLSDRGFDPVFTSPRNSFNLIVAEASKNGKIETESNVLNFVKEARKSESKSDSSVDNIKHRDILTLQVALLELGLYDGEIDGKFGPNTLNSARKLALNVNGKESEIFESAWAHLRIGGRNTLSGIWRGTAICQGNDTSVTLIAREGNKPGTKQVSGAVELGAPGTDTGWSVFTFEGTNINHQREFELRPRETVAGRDGAKFTVRGSVNGLATVFQAEMIGSGCKPFSLSKLPTPSKNIAPPPGVLDAIEPVHPDNLQGTWTWVTISRQNSGGFYNTRRRIRDEKIHLERVGPNRYKYNIALFGQIIKSEEEVVIADKKGKTLTLSAAGSGVGKNGSVPFSDVQVLRSKNGVDVLKWKETGLDMLVRFRDTPEAVNSGFGELALEDFCIRRALPLSETMGEEEATAKQLSQKYPEIYAAEDVVQATNAAIFVSPRFEQIFGYKYVSLSEWGQREVLERLFYCAILAPDDRLREKLGVGLVNNTMEGDIRALLKLGDKRNYYGTSRYSETPANLRISGYSVGKVASEIQEAEIGLSKINDTIKGGAGISGLEAWQLSGVVSEIRRISQILPPRRVADVVRLVGDHLNREKQIRAFAKEEELAATNPFSQSRLLFESTSKYILQNCTKAVLALQGSRNANLSVLFSREVRSVDGSCMIDFGTHIFRFNLARVTAISCSGKETQNCSFTVNWQCSYRINPAFGFSSGVSEFDPVCPLVRTTPVAMQGDYKVVNGRRWDATAIRW